jgi:hypothetical protein
MVDQGMRTPEVLAEVIDGATNLRQLDLILTSQRIEDMRFREVAERQPRLGWIREFDHRLGPAACSGPQRVRPSGNPRTKGVLGNLEITGGLEHGVQRYLQDVRSRVQLLQIRSLGCSHATILTRRREGDNNVLVVRKRTVAKKIPSLVRVPLRIDAQVPSE